jgi:hypothetical protein
MSLYVVIGPYAVLPDVLVARESGNHHTCPACADGQGRVGAFCNTCGTALVLDTIVEHRPIGQWDIPNDDERFYALDDHPRILLYNFQSPHVVKVDGDDRGETIALPSSTQEEALAWLADQAKPVSDWLAQQGHPPLGFRYGVVVGSF